MQQLHDYDQAFATFFARLQSDGITKDNTLFVITTEEEDHFVGGTPVNPGCDGVTTPCQWTHVNCPPTTGDDCTHNATEVNVNLRGLLATQRATRRRSRCTRTWRPRSTWTGIPHRDARSPARSSGTPPV